MEKVSRRDFMKLALLGAGAYAARDLLRILSQDVETQIVEIETKYATMYAFFESHGNRVSYASELEKRGVVPAIHFVEMVLGGSTDNFQREEKPSDILFYESASKDGQSFGPFLDMNTLVYFANNSTNVAYEGYKFVQVSNVAASVIGFGQEMAGGMYVVTESAPIGNMMKNIQDGLSEFNPADLLVKFRNIMTVRKLHTLSKHYHSLTGCKVDLSFSAGLIHKSGIENLLQMKPEEVLAKLDDFPISVLREIVKKNGGVENFCKTMVIPVREVLVDKQERKEFVVDKELMLHLNKRLG